MRKLVETNSHPTAEWIFHEVKNEHPDIGIATVYRNLSEFRENGEIISLGTINGQERFDAEVARHDHFICDDCGVIIDVPHNPNTEALYSKVSPMLGANVSDHRVTYYGKCRDCMTTDLT